MEEQIEYTLAAVDPVTRRPEAMSGGFARPPAPGAPAQLFAQCMHCHVEGSIAADGLDPGDHSAKLSLARRLLRDAGCPHVRSG